MNVSVSVITNASVNTVIYMEDRVLKVKLTASPVDGKANKALVAVLAKHYGVPKQCVSIVRGLKTKRKIVEIKKSGE